MLDRDITISKTILKHIDANVPIFISPPAIAKTLIEILPGVDELSHDEIVTLVGKERSLTDEMELKELEIHNYFFYSKKLSLLQVFKKSGGNLMKAVDFQNIKETHRKINKLILKSTSGKISNCSDKLVIDGRASLCIGSTSMFKAKWELPFTDVQPAQFYSNLPRQVDMLIAKERVGWEYSHGKNWTCLGIPMVPQTWLHILLPKEKDGLQNLIQEFDENLLKQCTKGMSCEATVSLPAFEIESCIYLNDKLGLPHLFSTNCLEKIFADKDSHRLNLAFHASKIKLNKIGSLVEDGVVKDFPQMDANFQHVEFHASHPFIFIIATYESYNLKAINSLGIYC